MELNIVCARISNNLGVDNDQELADLCFELDSVKIRLTTCDYCSEGSW